MREKVRRNAIDAAHFFGLAALYDERGKRQQAAECLESPWSQKGKADKQQQSSHVPGQ